MTSEQWAQLIPGILTALTAFGALLTAAAGWIESRKTTRVAEQTRDAVTGVQQATVDKLDYDRLRRMESALLTLQGCEGCRQQILELTERRRLRPRLETPEQQQ